MKIKIQSFFWGIIAACSALFIELTLSSFIKLEKLEALTVFFLISIAFSVFIEEIIKYIVVLRSIEPLSFGKSMIINAWIAGLGFSLTEIFIIYQKITLENITFNQLDLIKISLLHILTFGIFGYKIAIQENNKILIGTILVITLAHFTYNISTQYDDIIINSIGSIVLIILLLYNILGIIAVNKRLAHD